jgi:hypothetical protein
MRLKSLQIKFVIINLCAKIIPEALFNICYAETKDVFKKLVNYSQNNLL